MHWSSNRLLPTVLLLAVSVPGTTRAFNISQGNGQDLAWGSNEVTIEVHEDSFPSGDPFRGALSILVNRFNDNPSQFEYDLDFDVENVGLSNGDSEIWFTSSLGAPARADWRYWTGSGEVFEADVRVDSGRTWTAGILKDETTPYDGVGRPFRNVVIHEIGHGLGLAHETDTYNAMGQDWDHIHANGGIARGYFGEDASNGTVAQYGLDSDKGEDLSVTHWRHTGDDGEYSSHGRTRIFDTSGSELPNVSWGDEPRYRVTRGETVEVELTYENNGVSTHTVDAGFYLSSNDLITTLDRHLRTVGVILGRNDIWTTRFQVEIPSDLLPNTDYHIGVIVDEQDSVDENLEANNATYIGIRTDRGDLPDAFTQWVGTYEGRNDGRRARLTITGDASGVSRHEDAGFDIQWEDLDRGTTFTGTASYRLKGPKHELEIGQLTASDGTTKEVPRLLQHTWDTDYISGATRWSGDPFGAGFVREGPKADLLTGRSGRVLDTDRPKEEWSGVYEGRSDGREAELEIQATDEVTSGDIGQYLIFDVTLNDLDRATEFHGSGLVSQGGPAHVMELATPLEAPDGTTKDVRRLLLHTWDQTFISGYNEWRGSPFGLLFARKPFVFVGVPHLVLGEAVLTLSDAGLLEVSNIGSSGEDGVDLAFDAPAGRVDLVFERLALREEAARAEFSLTGRSRDGESGLLGHAGLERLQDQVRLFADFSPVEATGLRFELYRQGELIAISESADEVLLMPEQEEGLQLRGLNADAGLNNQGEPFMTVVLDRETGARLVSEGSATADGDPLVTDQVRVVAEGGRRVDGIDSLRVRAANVESIVIEDEEVTPMTDEDCLPFDPEMATVEQIDGDWVITAGDSILLNFGGAEEEAQRAHEIIQAYGLDQQCFVGRPEPSMEYFLVDGEAPVGSIEGEDCLAFDPAEVEVVEMDGRWAIVEGSHVLLDFGESREEAEEALAVIRKYGFNEICFVGRPDPSMTYFKRTPQPAEPDLVIDHFVLSGEGPFDPGTALGDRIELIISNAADAAIETGFSVGFYLSPDETIDRDDSLLIGGREQVDALEGGEVVEVPLFGEASIPQDYPAGAAYLGVLVDETDQVSESNEANNVASVPVTIGEGGGTIEPEPRLSIERSGEQELTLSWQGDRILQRADEITGPWETVPDVTSPFTIPLEGPRRFYRIVDEGRPVAALPAFRVVRKGISEEQFNVLARQFELPAAAFGEAGTVEYTDAEGFQAVPLAEPVEAEPINEDENADIVEERFLFDEIQGMSVPDEEAAVDRVQTAFADAQMLPGAPYATESMVQHSHFEAVTTDGEVLVDQPVDTQVAFQVQLDGYPVVGRGARLKAVLDGQENLTRLAYFLRHVERGQQHAILPQEEADAIIESQYEALLRELDGELQLESEVVYYAPPIDERSEVEVLIPHYQYEGEFVPLGTEETVPLRRTLVPAFQPDTGLVPEAELEAAVDGDTIGAEARVAGGTPPYTFEWHSSTTTLEADTGEGIQYQVGPAKESPVAETLTLTVTDANGIQAYDSRTFEVEAERFEPMGPMAQGHIRPQVGGIKDAGTEWVGTSQGLPGSSGNAGGFASRFAVDSGTALRFDWGDFSAWERDFKDPAVGGTATDWIDNVDVAFYTGHANANGWTFPGNQDDGFLHRSEAAFGRNDLEWLTVAACGPLQPGSSPNRWWQRWGPAFQGLHLLCGYQTITYDNQVEGQKWAGKMLNGQTVRRAWMETGMEVQGPEEIVAVMGVFGPDGASNWNDHYHGHGPIGPDIHDIRGYWMISSPGD